MGITSYLETRAAHNKLNDFVLNSGAHQKAVWALEDRTGTENKVVPPSARECADALVSNLTREQIWAVLRGTSSANSNPMIRLVPPAQNGSTGWVVLICNANPHVNMHGAFQVPFYTLVDIGISDLLDHGVTPISPDSYKEVIMRSQKRYDGFGQIDRQGFVLLNDGTDKGVDAEYPFIDSRLYGHGLYGRPHIVQGAKNLGYFTVGMRSQVGVVIPS